MAVYACNSNGDWWEVTQDSQIFIIDTKDGDIAEALQEREIEEGGDKFEDFIKEFGVDALAQIKKTLVEDEETLKEYQDQEEEEDYGDAMTSMQRKEYEGRTEALSWVLSLFAPWEGWE